MNKKIIAAALSSLCATLLLQPSSFGQDVSGTFNNLLVSGTGTIAVLSSGTANINLLKVTGPTALTGGFTASGTADIVGNVLYLGAWSDDISQPGIAITYNDGTGGMNSTITQSATRPLTIWNWQRMMASGSEGYNAMQLDASNRLILTGTAGVNPPQLILDPNGSASLNGSNLLTQNLANSLYMSSTVGITASNGNIGIGTTTPTAKLDLRGNLSVASGSSSALFVDIASGNVGLGTGTPSVKLDVKGDLNAGNRINLGLSAPGTTFNSGTIGLMLRPSLGDRAIMELHSPSNKVIGVVQAVDNRGLVISSLTSMPTIFDQTYSGSYIQIAGSWVGQGLAFSGTCGGVNDVGLGRRFPGELQITDGSLGMGTLVAGTIGIGSATPRATLDISETKTDANKGIYNTAFVEAFWNPSVTDNTYFHSAANFAAYSSGTADINGFLGFRSVYATTGIWGGTSAINVNQASAFYSDIRGSAGVIKNGYGFFAGSPLPVASGSIGNLYGVYVNSQKVAGVTKGYGVYQSSGNDTNFFAGAVGIGAGCSDPQATLDVNGSVKVSGSLAISGTGSLTLPDGTVLSSSNTLKSAISSGTVLTISGAITSSQVTGLTALIPTNNIQLANGAGYITGSGTAAFAQASGTAAAMSGTIHVSQVAGIDAVAKGDNLDYSRLVNVPDNVAAIANSGTAKNIALSGTTKITGAVLIPEQGDLSMGTFTAGTPPQ